MYKILYTQIENSLFCEERIVFFATGKGNSGSSGGGGVEGDLDKEDEDVTSEDKKKKDEKKKKEEGDKKAKEEKDEKEKEKKDKEKKEKDVEKAKVKVAPELNDATQGAAEGVQKVLSEYAYNPPPGIEKETIINAKSGVDEIMKELNPLNKELGNMCSQFIEENLKNNIPPEIAAAGPKAIARYAKKFYPDVLSAVEGLIRDYEYAEAKDADFKSKPPSAAARAGLLAEQLNSLSKKMSGDKIPGAGAEAWALKFVTVIDKITEKEWEMVQIINQVKETMWDAKDTAEKRHRDAREITDAQNYVGLPIKEGQELTGMSLAWAKNERSGGDYVAEIPRRWTIRKVLVNEPNPDAEGEVRKGVWVEIQKEGSSQYQTMSLKNFRDFVNVRDLKPAIEHKEQLKEAVPYLSEIGVKIGDAPFTVEYDVFEKDADGNQVTTPTNAVVQSIDDTGVTFENEVVYRSRFCTVDLAEDDTKSKMTYAEFAKWLNQTQAIPEMPKDDLQSKLNWLAKATDTKYGRDPDCHGPIRLERGEYLFADAPGNPIYRIENVADGKIDINLGNNQMQTFTFVQFLRWVQKYEMERYDPEFEVNKAIKYGDLDENNDEEKAKIRDRSEKAKERLDDPDKWREHMEAIQGREEDGEIYIPEDIEPGEEGAEGTDGEKQKEIIWKKKEELLAQKTGDSFLRKFWRETYFLTPNDIGTLFKTGYDYYLRNWERRQKKRYSAIGKGLPWFGTEYERVNQQAENEEVSQFKDAMDQWGIWQIEETLYQTGNQDQAKACFQVLAEKGMIRWDNWKLWNAVNKFTDNYHKIPIPQNTKDDTSQPYAKGAGRFKGRDVKGRTGMDLLPEAIDSIWGESSHISWKRQNDGVVEDNIQKSYNKAEELENDPKNTGVGIGSELSFLLEKHMNGEFIDPSEYEGMIRFIIEAGKSGGEEKVYYLLMGATLENDDGRTIIGWERLGRFISKYCNSFPAIDYFTDMNPRRHPARPDEFTKGAWTKSDFQSFTEQWRATARQDSYSPPKSVKDFLYNEVLTSDALQTRLEKGIRNAEKMDHDDSPLFIPGLKESAIDDICSSSSGASKKFTIPAYKNAYVGYGLRLNAITAKYDMEKEIDKEGNPSLWNSYRDKAVYTLQAFMRYDAILDDRYERGKGTMYQRLTSADFNTGNVWDISNATGMYQKEMQGVIKKIIATYNPTNKDDLLVAFEKPHPPSSMGTDAETEAAQKKYNNQINRINNAIKNFGEIFSSMIMVDDGKKMIDIIRDQSFMAEKSLSITPEEKLRNLMSLEQPGSGSASSAAA